MRGPDLFLGLDVGTSQARACIIDADGTVAAFAGAPIPEPVCTDGRVEQEPALWWQAAERALDEALAQVGSTYVHSIAVAGTSGTLLLADAAGCPLGPALMYNDQSAVAEARTIDVVAPADSSARGNGSALARLLILRKRHPGAAIALHQADWIAGRLLGHFGASDWNNALKLGFDPAAEAWPDWMESLGVPPGILPRPVAPGRRLGRVGQDAARRFGLRADTAVVAGTTDSIAAALAAGLSRTGDAVTSLGSTLVLKLATDRPIASARHGIYTHRVGPDLWLAGGASNSGGSVLRRYFSADRITELSARIDPAVEIGLDYYPLPASGERFPISDAALQPRLEPRPDDDALFLHGLFEGMARIERDGYRLLRDFGTPYPTEVLTSGGGAANAVWSDIRSRVLGVPVRAAGQQEAAFGAALLARRGIA